MDWRMEVCLTTKVRRLRIQCSPPPWQSFCGKVANLHMRTDPKNLVTIARTIHLPEQEETIHMISMLRKEACSGSIHDLAHLPTQSCLTKASAKADNLITAVQTRKFLDVDIHPDLKTLIEHKAFLSTWCKTFLHTREKEVFSLNTLSTSLAQTSPRRTMSGDVCGGLSSKRSKRN